LVTEGSVGQWNTSRAWENTITSEEGSGTINAGGDHGGEVSRNGPPVTSQGVIIAFGINAWKGRRGGGQCARIEFSASFFILALLARFVLIAGSTQACVSLLFFLLLA